MNDVEILETVNAACGTDYDDLDVVSYRELLVTYAALLMNTTGAQTFLCRPHTILEAQDEAG